MQCDCVLRKCIRVLKKNIALWDYAYYNNRYVTGKF